MSMTSDENAFKIHLTKRPEEALWAEITDECYIANSPFSQDFNLRT